MGRRSVSAAAARVTRTAVLLAALAGPVLALDPNHHITQYGHKSWTVQDGKLPGGVYALTQSRDGWLWVGTEFGLFRFDGVRFTPVELPGGEAGRGQTILSLAAAPDGGVWIGTRSGLLRWNRSAVHRYVTAQGGRDLPVVAIHVDRSSGVWVGTIGFGLGGIARMEGGGLRFFGPADGFGGSGVQSIAEDNAGNVWFGCTNGLYRWDGHEFHEIGALGRVAATARNSQGEIIAGTYLNALRRFINGILHEFPVGDKSLQIPTRALLIDRDGGLWAGTNDRGLIHFHRGGADRFAHPDGLSGSTIVRLFEDSEGNVWVATERGLDRFRDLPVTILSKREGLSQDMAGSVYPSRSGGMWVGTSAGLNYVEKGRIAVFTGRSGLPSEIIGSILEDRLGRIWVAAGTGMAIGASGRFHRSGFDASGAANISAIAEDRDGIVWLADWNRGLISIGANRVETVIPWSSFDNKRAWALQADYARGGLLIGFAQGGVAHFREGSPPKWYTAADGLGKDAVTDILIDSQGNAWIATQHGLSKLRDGRFITLTTANGLACEQIHAMVEDQDGGIWLNTPCGLQALSPKELHAWGDHPEIRIHPRVYTAGDGMRLRSSMGGSFRLAARSTDGRLWFPVGDGVAVVDPERLHEQPLPPPVVIETVRVDDQEFAPVPNLGVGPIGKELQIDYTALSFADPERVRFRYRLEGHDTEWRDMVGRRQAFYGRLPPKRYRFRVTASSRDGVWNEAGASLDITVAPAVHQTAWFQVLCVAAGGGSLWSMHRLRLARIQAKLHERFEERLSERERIGRELHDTLLQSILGFALQLDGLSKTVTAEPEATRESLRELRREAERCVHDARESVWDLRSTAADEQDFCEAVRRAGEETTRHAEIQFSMTISGSQRAIPPQAQEHLLRIVREALHNSVRHSEATGIRVEICFLTPGQMTVRISDNGIGFDLASASQRSGHWGLVTMRERAEKLGAEIRLESAPGKGTCVEIIVPNLSAAKGTGSHE